jgi:hypothetical protein
MVLKVKETENLTEETQMKPDFEELSDKCKFKYEI